MNEKNALKFVLFTFIFHHIAMFIGAINSGWPIWIPMVIMVCLVASIIVLLGKYWDFAGTALFHSLMVNISIVVYGSHADSISDIIVPFLGITVVMGLYGIQKLMGVSIVAISFLIFYHRFVTHSYAVRSIDDVYHYVMPFVNIYFIISVLYFWNLKRNESAQRMGNIIRDLKFAERGKDDFLANVSHEIRTPVNNVVGMSEVILREELEEKVRDDVLSIQTSGRQLVSLVSDILDFSELQSGKQKLVEVEYNIDSTINDIIKMANAMKRNKDVDIIIDCDGSMPVNLIGDEQKLRRVILNLLNNAIKFTNQGCIILSIGYRKEEYGINLNVSVKDTGIGIDKKNIERLFTVYNQVDSKRNRQEGGIGLGLAIARSIISTMGGVISVNSEVEKGSEFKFVVPQKIKNDETLVTPYHTGKMRMLMYFNIEQLDHVRIRDAYIHQIKNIVSDLNIQMHLCHNLAELKRRIERDETAYVVISFFEYNEDKEYFNELARKRQVAVIIDNNNEKEISSYNIVKIYKPLYVGSFVDSISDEQRHRNDKFTAPDAKILIVDDNMINLKVVSGLLEPYKMQVFLSTSGADALEKIDKTQFDLIFMDHMMPEMDGIETLKRIRNKTGLYYKEVPIIALTANAVAGAREMFIAEGFQEFISKPVELSVLEREIKNFISPNKLIYTNFDVKEDHNNISTENEVEIYNVDAGLKEETKEETKDLGDLNIEQGVSYCGSMENLIDILEIHCKDGEENYKKISDFYDQRDWKNYSILVHGLKSSMKSVGADILSEKARLLESASKSLDEAYIYANHEDMMKEYERILNILYKYFGMSGNEQEEVCDLPELMEEDFESYISQFEAATYSWDEVQLRKVVELFEGHSYKNSSMASIVETVKNKIEMSDYMSALENLKKWKDKLDRKA